MITLIAIIVIVLFSALVGSTVAWVIARTLLDAIEPTPEPNYRIRASRRER